MANSDNIEAKKKAILRYREKLLDARVYLTDAIDLIDGAQDAFSGSYKIDGFKDTNSYYLNNKDDLLDVLDTLNIMITNVEAKAKELGANFVEAIQLEGSITNPRPITGGGINPVINIGIGKVDDSVIKNWRF